VFRLNGTDPHLPLDDLEPLRQIVGDASFVGLGETVHTSGGYYEMKHRLFRYLVERMGFRVLAFETTWDNAESVEQYLETCDGGAEDHEDDGNGPDDDHAESPWEDHRGGNGPDSRGAHNAALAVSGSAQAAVRGIFPVWQSAEVRDLARWMCDWNRSHHQAKDRLHFYGFDIQQPDNDGPALMEFLSRIGVAADDSRILGIGKCDRVAGWFYPTPVPERDHVACTDALASVENLFTKDEARIVQLTSRHDLDWARLRRLGLQAWEDEAFFNYSIPGRSFEARDRAMAYMVEAIRELEFPDEPRTVVWAHNVHLSKAGSEYYLGSTMGTFLNGTLGDSYVALGLAAYSVSIDWYGVGCGPAFVRYDGSVERILHDLGNDYLLVDLDSPGGSTPLLQPNAPYRIGNLMMVPRRQFDGLVYMRYARPMTPLAWPVCGEALTLQSNRQPLGPDHGLIPDSGQTRNLGQAPSIGQRSRAISNDR
jgi:erythromycin esterase-like protein